MKEPEARHDVRTVNRGLGEGFAGVINELLIQLQSFDEPTTGEKFSGWCVSKVNRFLPARWEIKKRPPVSSNILVIGATNRASALDPALLRPGRFDRSIHFDLPSPVGPSRDHRLLPRPRRPTSPSSTRKSAATSSPRSRSGTRR